MSVTLPIFQSAPTLEQMKSIAHFDNNENSNLGFLSEAANGNLYVARTTDYSNYVSVLNGLYNSNYPINYCYILYAKSNTSITRWIYNQSLGERVLEYSPWTGNVVTYNNNQYLIATPSFNTNEYFVTTGCWNDCPVYSSIDDFFAIEQPIVYTGSVAYPITYSSSNSTVSGPTEAAVDDTVTVSAVPDVGYGITDASTQILVTNNDIAVPYTWDATNNRITFTMPDPS